MNRRELLAMLAGGAVVTAEGLWVPGRKLISIPKSQSIIDIERMKSAELRLMLDRAYMQAFPPYMKTITI